MPLLKNMIFDSSCYSQTLQNLTNFWRAKLIPFFHFTSWYARLSIFFFSGTWIITPRQEYPNIFLSTVNYALNFSALLWKRTLALIAQHGRIIWKLKWRKKKFISCYFYFNHLFSKNLSASASTPANITYSRREFDSNIFCGLESINLIAS